jgi:hypothetical protein
MQFHNESAYGQNETRSLFRSCVFDAKRRENWVTAAIAPDGWEVRRAALSGAQPTESAHLLTAKQMGAAVAHARPAAPLGRSVRHAATDQQTQPYSTTKSIGVPQRASPKLGRFDRSPVRTTRRSALQ